MNVSTHNIQENALIDFAIKRWRTADTTANTGTRGQAEARRLCGAFISQFGPAPFASLTEPMIFDWLRMVNDEPCWRSRSRRPNRALPPRVIRSLLRCVGYAQTDSITEYRQYHRMCGVELIEWRQELTHCGSFKSGPMGDDQCLWNAYVSEWITSKGAEKTRCDRYRTWMAHIGYELDNLNAPAAAPGLPFGFTDPVYACIDPFVRFFVAIRWAHNGSTDALDLFRTLAQYCDRIDNTPHSQTMRSYIRPFYHLCVALAPSSRCGSENKSLVDCLDGTTRAACVAALQCMTIDKGRCVKCVYQFTVDGPWAPLLRWSQWRAISRREASYRPPKRRRMRDRFSDGEVLQIQKVALVDPFSHGMLTFLLQSDHIASLYVCHNMARGHTGCRTGAVCSLQVMDVMDTLADTPPWRGKMKMVGTVLEKGGAIRQFGIDPILAAALESAIQPAMGMVLVPIAEYPM